MSLISNASLRLLLILSFAQLKQMFYIVKTAHNLNHNKIKQVMQKAVPSKSYS